MYVKMARVARDVLWRIDDVAAFAIHRATQGLISFARHFRSNLRVQ